MFGAIFVFTASPRVTTVVCKASTSDLADTTFADVVFAKKPICARRDVSCFTGAASFAVFATTTQIIHCTKQVGATLAGVVTWASCFFPVIIRLASRWDTASQGATDEITCTPSIFITWAACLTGITCFCTEPL